MGNPIRVVVVDHHPVLAGALQRALSLSGIDVAAVARSIASARVEVREHRPDVVVMDYSLPDGDGAAATRTLLGDHPGLRVVMLAGSPTDDILIRAMEAGCVGFITKEHGVADVVDAVRAAHAGQSPLSEEMLARLVALSGRGPQPPGPALTAREQEVLVMLADGASTEAVAGALGISENTARNHVRGLLSKLGARSRLEAVARARRDGLLPSL